jgi:hypothetical protein
VALQRGPIVYCAEWPDNGGTVRNLMLPNASALQPTARPDLLGGVTTLTGTADSLAYDASGKVVNTPTPFVAIPYYAWANRGRGEMMVWIPNTLASAHPTPVPTIASRAKVTTSRGNNPSAINDQSDPTSSEDQTSFFHWWPKKGTTEWAEMAFEGATTVSETEIYWFDDTHRGECRTPESWRLLYKDGESWKPVETTEPFGTALDTFNRVRFKPVNTTALRLEVKLKPNWSAGIQEWRVK